ncbi:HDOD domain-containing protein [Sideroxydans lithotrophicus]|uniref:Putative signal transduction protein n=1 Tax=Sideroxydans lithotrophicus (strain ES-1) TaxID=580332 RepID=D5CNQ4_SIDLE|nr:HDOD domain-containing protein [Sideroxydans lithotrophicus]ADE10967.1 putative signal transduction protein [Sideroxydans lithotrophicus ES-1]
MNAPIDLRQAVRNLNSLPAMPVIAQKLMALKLDSDEGEREMMLLISQDPMISAKIIGLANSPLLGTTRKIAAVKDAAMLLGLTRVKSVATGIAVMSLVSKPIGRFDPQELWLHNMGVAFGMLPVVRAMPARNRPQDDQIFLAGMLHDIGYLALAHLDTQRSDDLHTRFVIEPDRLAIEVERELLEMTHDELGAELAKHWNLPSEVVAVLRYHHTPDVAEAAEGQPLVRIVNITERLLPQLGVREYVGNYVAPEEWEALGIDPDRADEITEQVVEQANQAAQFTNSFS